MEKLPKTPPWMMFFDGQLYQKYDEFMKTKDFSKILINTKLRLASSNNSESISSSHTIPEDYWDKEQIVGPTGNTYPYVTADYFQRNKEDEKRRKQRTQRTRAFIILGIIILAVLAFGTALVIHYFLTPPFDARNPKTFVNVSFSWNNTASIIPGISKGRLSSEITEVTTKTASMTKETAKYTRGTTTARRKVTRTSEATSVTSGITIPYLETVTSEKLTTPLYWSTTSLHEQIITTSPKSTESSTLPETTTELQETTKTLPATTETLFGTSTALPESTSTLSETTTTLLETTSTMQTTNTIISEATTGYSETITSIPRTTTSIPETTTFIPETTTSMPKTTTSIPETTTSIQETTTAIQETTTYIPETTTFIPETTTSITETTTSIPETTTSVQETTTSIPGTTTYIPKATAFIPETTTSMPKTTTSIPETTTSIPETTTSIQETTTSKPVKTTSIPETTTIIPETTTIIPTTTTTLQTTTLPEKYNIIQMRDVVAYTFENTTLDCSVEHAIKWTSLSLKINQKWRPLEVTLFPSGEIKWSRAKTRRHDVTYDITNSTDGTGSNMTIRLIINDVQCRDGNTYICSLKSDIVDGMADSRLTVVGKPSNKITLNLGPSIIEDKAFRITASWQGGYPIPWANMSWTAFDANNKSYNLAEYGEFRDYVLHKDNQFCQTRLQHSIVVFPKVHLNDTTVIVQPNLQATKYFVNKSMEKYLRNVQPGVEKILVIPLNYCKNGKKDTSVPHPYTPCTKFLRCLSGDMVVQQCPRGTCFYENAQQCG